MLKIRVRRAEDGLHLMVSDQGPESGLSQVLGDAHVGNLYSLRERAALLGGNLVFETLEDQTSRIIAFFPLVDSMRGELGQTQLPE